jgi:hypothetical protein
VLYRSGPRFLLSSLAALPQMRDRPVEQIVANRQYRVGIPWWRLGLLQVTAGRSIIAAGVTIKNNVLVPLHCH